MAAPYTIFATTGDYDSVRTIGVNCQGVLNPGELLVAAEAAGEEPEYPAATTGAGLTISAVTVNDTATEMDGVPVAVGEGLYIDVIAPTAGSYTIRIFMKTNATTAQKPISEIELDVVA